MIQVFISKRLIHQTLFRPVYVLSPPTNFSPAGLLLPCPQTLFASNPPLQVALPLQMEQPALKTFSFTAAWPLIQQYDYLSSFIEC